MSLNHLTFTEPWSHKGEDLRQGYVADRNFVPASSSAAAVSYNHDVASDPRTHTTSPIVTGTSVIGLKYKDGVMLAADNLASYGSMARFRDIERILKVGDHTIIGIGGDISDLQYIENLLNQLTISERDAADGHILGPEQIYEYLSRVMYNRRSKMNPLWNAIVVAGINPVTRRIVTPAMTPSLEQKNRQGAFLGFVDLLGTTYSAPVIATGMGSAMAIPLLRKATDNDAWKTLEADDARKVLDECMKVLFYRDARSLNKFTVAKVASTTDESGASTGIAVTFEKDQSVATQWAFAEKQYGYK
ncbi:Proteasome subunit beta type-7 [Savitreella phatthalungensis]